MYELKDALRALKNGEIILVYDGDGREEEVDMMVASQFATPEVVRAMRKDGGGLICTSVHSDIAETLSIPFITDVWRSSMEEYPIFRDLEANDIPYDEKSSFSITINHRKTFTGITDNDRSMTITEFTNLGAGALNGTDPAEFGKNFRSPGHVILLRAARGLLAARKGHTELSITMMEMAGLAPVSTICEMMGDDGNALKTKDAMVYAEKNNLVFLEGRSILSEWTAQQDK